VAVNDRVEFTGVAYQDRRTMHEAPAHTFEAATEDLAYPPADDGLFQTVLRAHGGDKVAAAVEVGRDLMRRDLMRRDPAKCKAGYSRDSAVLAVARLYDLDEQQQAQVRERLPEEPSD
jgi:hypothetical protein